MWGSVYARCLALTQQMRHQRPSEVAVDVGVRLAPEAAETEFFDTQHPAVQQSMQHPPQHDRQHLGQQEQHRQKSPTSAAAVEGGDQHQQQHHHHHHHHHSWPMHDAPAESFHTMAVAGGGGMSPVRGHVTSDDDAENSGQRRQSPTVPPIPRIPSRFLRPPGSPPGKPGRPAGSKSVVIVAPPSHRETASLNSRRATVAVPPSSSSSSSSLMEEAATLRRPTHAPPPPPKSASQPFRPGPSDPPHRRPVHPPRGSSLAASAAEGTTSGGPRGSGRAPVRPQRS
ncbi:hypothetical protein BC828DRAFT_267887 [Blastocladiella britannica]|nr:hypothetical protein BC828DRAFT_267887 [Blastocladiella britannica]